MTAPRTNASGRSDRRASGISDYAPGWLVRVGYRSWLLIGALTAAAALYLGLAALSGLFVPLIVAAVIGILFAPVVDVMERWRVPRGLGAGLVMLGIGAVGVACVWLTVAGVIDQGTEIREQVVAGLDELGSTLDDLGLSVDDGGQVVDSVGSTGSDLAKGVAGYVSTVFSSLFSFVVGVFVGALLLYYLLKDWELLRSWVAEHMGVPADLGTVIIEDTTSAVRQYFSGITVSSVIVATVIGITMVILGLPLAFAIALVTFVSAYIPYLGAFFSGAFAFLVALGSGGLEKALVVLAMVLVAQNVIDTLVRNKLTSDELNLHPIVNFGSTIVGASVAGVLGATLSSPIVASLIRIFGRVRDYHWQTSPQDADSVEGAMES